MPEKPMISRVLNFAGGAVWRSLPALALLTAGCVDPAAGPSACDGLSDKTLAITRADYTECSGEILAALDELETSLRKFVDGDKEAKEPARSASRRLAHLMGEVGFREDTWREVKHGSGRVVERWPDSGMREFNAAVGNAAAQFNAALVFPNQDNLQQGVKLHAEARNAYSRFR